MAFRTTDAARLLALTAAQVRALARTGVVTPERGPRGEYHFSFQDMVLLRTASSLRRAHVPHTRMERAFNCLRGKLPPEQPLSAYHIEAHGERIVVSDGARSWDIETDQLEIQFPRPLPVVRILETNTPTDAEAWYQKGIELESVSPAAAEDAYLHAVELEPKHAEAHVNLGRLLHQQGRVSAAAERYRFALLQAPHATAAYNLGIALEDLGRRTEATQAYKTALELDPNLAEAHFNLAHVYQLTGDRVSAIRHLKAYKQLTEHKPV